MSELEDRLNSILSDPQAMGRIMSLAQSLGGSSPAADEPPPAPPEQGGPPDLSALMGSLAGEGGPDPRLLAMISKVAGEYGRDDDKKTALLNALRPYVKEKRYAKLDKAIQIARLSRLIRVALEAFKGGEYV